MIGYESGLARIDNDESGAFVKNIYRASNITHALAKKLRRSKNKEELSPEEIRKLNYIHTQIADASTHFIVLVDSGHSLHE